MVKERTAMSTEKITQILIQLESEDRVHFTKKENMIASTLKAYVFSKFVAWYWITVVLALVTVLTVFTLPDTAYPIAYVRLLFSLVFILFLPGFAFVKALYPLKLPIPTISENLDTIERIALSFGLSIVLVSIVVLVLYNTPLGIGIAPITFSLLALTVTFASVGMLREYQMLYPKIG